MEIHPLQCWHSPEPSHRPQTRSPFMPEPFGAQSWHSDVPWHSAHFFGGSAATGCDVDATLGSVRPAPRTASGRDVVPMTCVTCMTASISRHGAAHGGRYWTAFMPRAAATADAVKTARRHNLTRKPGWTRFGPWLWCVAGGAPCPSRLGGTRRHSHGFSSEIIR